MIEKGQHVTIKYSIRTENEMDFEDDKAEKALSYIQGERQIFSTLEAALTSLQEGDQKEVILRPEEAYGPTHEDALKTVALDTIPENYRHVGAVLGLKDDDDHVYHVCVCDMGETTATLDLNHPLAGQMLIFNVKIVSIE